MPENGYVSENKSEFLNRWRVLDGVSVTLECLLIVRKK